MFYFVVGIRCACYGNDVEAYWGIDAITLDVGVGGNGYGLRLLVTHGFLGFHEYRIAACLDLDDNQFSVFMCDDVEVAVTTAPVPAEYFITLVFEITGSCVFTPFA